MQEYRKRRFIGDVPPVYPNGWFAVLDSDQLKAGQLKYVSALGKYNWYLEQFESEYFQWKHPRSKIEKKIHEKLSLNNC